MYILEGVKLQVRNLTSFLQNNYLKDENYVISRICCVHWSARILSGKMSLSPVKFDEYFSMHLSVASLIARVSVPFWVDAGYNTKLGITVLDAIS